MKDEETTAKSYYQLFYLNLQTKSDQQFSNMCLAAINFCKCFEETEKYIEELEQIYYDPIGFAINFHKTLFEKRINRLQNIKLPLFRLDWIFFRDTVVRSKLNIPYYTDFAKSSIRTKQEFYLGDVTDIFAIIKKRMCEIITKISKENEIKIELQFPILEQSPLESVGIEEK